MRITAPEYIKIVSQVYVTYKKTSEILIRGKSKRKVSLEKRFFRKLDADEISLALIPLISKLSIPIITAKRKIYITADFDLKVQNDGIVFLVAYNYFNPKSDKLEIIDGLISSGYEEVKKEDLFAKYDEEYDEDDEDDEDDE